MNEKFWPVPCCAVIWPTARDYERHVHQQHTREQILDLLVEATQNLALERGNAAALRLKASDLEAERRSILTEFDEWREKAAHRLRVREAAERIAELSRGLNARLAAGSDQKPETD